LLKYISELENAETKYSKALLIIIYTVNQSCRWYKPCLAGKNTTRFLLDEQHIPHTLLCMLTFTHLHLN